MPSRRILLAREVRAKSLLQGHINLQIPGSCLLRVQDTKGVVCDDRTVCKTGWRPAKECMNHATSRGDRVSPFRHLLECSSGLWRPCVKHLIANSWREHPVHVLPRKPEHLTYESSTPSYHCCYEAAGTTCPVLSFGQSLQPVYWQHEMSKYNVHQ